METIIILVIIFSVLFLGLFLSNQWHNIKKNFSYWLAFCFLGSFYQSIYFVLSWNYDLNPGFCPMGTMEVVFIGLILTFLCFVVSSPLILLLKVTLKKSRSALINSLVILGYFVLVDIIIRVFLNEYWNLQDTLEIDLPYFIIALLVFLVWLRQDKKGSLE